MVAAYITTLMHSYTFVTGVCLREIHFPGFALECELSEHNYYSSLFVSISFKPCQALTTPPFPPL